MPPKPTPEKKKTAKKPVKEKKKPASAAMVAEYQRKVTDQALKECAAKYGVWTGFPYAEDDAYICVRAVLITGKTQGKLIDIVALAADPQNIFRTSAEPESEIAHVPVGTPLFIIDEESEKHSWYCGTEPSVPGLKRLEEKKVAASEEWGSYGKDSSVADAWDKEAVAITSISASSFREATIAALDLLLIHENSVDRIPVGFIPVIIADPQTYGLQARMIYHECWYIGKTKTWMKPPASGRKDWTKADPPEKGSPAALVVFRDSKKKVIRSDYDTFVADNLDAEPVSLDDLEKLVPKDDQTPLNDTAALMQRLEACDETQLRSGDYIVGLETMYAVFRLRGVQTGRPRRVVPRVSGDSLYDLPNGDYVAYGYTVPGTGKDLVQEYRATVTNKTLTINGSVGDEIEIWPKTAVRRQALIDSLKPARLPVVTAMNGEWRDNLSAFCAHYHLADATTVVVFPMKPCDATDDLAWHVTADAAELRYYLENAPPSTVVADPPPSLDEIWMNVPGVHATIEWYRGAWDNPVNPRIFAKDGLWSRIAKAGKQAGGGRETVDPFTGESGPTAVTSDLRDDYHSFINSHPASEVTAEITTKNIAS